MFTTADFDLGFRPDYGFAEFDRLLARLRDAIPDVGVRAEVLAALELEGRDLDIAELSDELPLGPTVMTIVEQLAAFGDDGDWVHAFGSVLVARISAGSLAGMCDATAFVMATRKGNRIEYSWEDENGGAGDLGESDQPLSMAELIAMIDRVLLTQEGYADGGDWREVYLGDDTMLVAVTSAFYPQLREWYERAVRDWTAEHGTWG